MYIGKTDYNTSRKLKNEGIKFTNNIGDLYINFKFILPDISINNKDLLKNILNSEDIIIYDSNLLSI